jgi:signal transduction histidine kinase
MVADPPRSSRFGTVRARTAVAATVVVGVALVVGAFGLVVLLRRSLVHDIDETAELRAADIAALTEAELLRESLPAAVDDEEALVQVVDAEGRVLAASQSLRGRPRISDRAPEGDEIDHWTDGDLAVGGNRGYRIAALASPSRAGPATVYVASSLELLQESVATVRNALVVGVPALIGLVAVTSWWLVGGALRPVEAIRRRVAEISDSSLDERVPVPPAADEVSRLAQTMNAMLDRLERSAIRQRRFVADASHDLQTPLAAIRTQLEVAIAHPDAEDWQRATRRMLEQHGHMERLVQDLLYVARLDEGARTRPTTQVDLDDIVLAQATLVRAPGRVQVDSSAVSGACVLGNRDDLTRMVGNLLDNAQRHARSRVTLELASDDAVVTFAVEDDGPGIPASARSQVFERFAKLDDARAGRNGSAGLGLAIVREIVLAHGGAVAVADSDGGARLVVTLPAR